MKAIKSHIPINIENEQTILNEQIEKKKLEMSSKCNNILNLKEILNLISSLAKQKQENNKEKKDLDCLGIVSAIIFSSILLIGGQFISAIILSASCIFLEKSLYNQSYKELLNSIRLIEIRIKDLENHLGIEYTLDIDKIKSVLRENQINKKITNIEIETLKQKIDYYNNIINIVNFYQKYPYFQEKSKEYIIQNYPHLEQIIEKSASFLENEWQNYLKELNYNSIYREENASIPYIELEYKKLNLKNN